MGAGRSRHRRSATAVNAETAFEAASLSKPVFGCIVLRLVDRGEFDLDRPRFEIADELRF